MFLPLTKRSTESMKKMQELNPVIQELREKYKDKPDVLNKKIMEVYKKNKVNPMGGCLPLLLQMPFFFALYSALINSVDLWQAPFILWIKDLSLPDTVFTISGFNINILPIVMTATTYLQQKMSTGEASQQQKMLLFMPLIFIVIFWNMPSGLVLYWIMQNVLQIAHQMIINRKSKTEK
jgi:YidC/Oxa1 family membrane protein insertase